MNTDGPKPIPLSDSNQQPSTDFSNNDFGQPLADLVDVLQSVDTEALEAGLNATSIEDFKSILINLLYR